ncbi:MAG: hypothetical protein FD165_2037 [Gammaproteobacteria bacterium]|nr:MAG: hypothetical protein FD165_2037 [Gammaproteobacteria bacterium]
MTMRGRMSRALTAALLALGLIVPAHARAEVAPFYTRNLSPFIQIFGLPAMESGALAPAGSIDTKLALDIANNSIQGGNDLEQVVIDGETYRAALTLRYRVSPAIELGLDVPLVHHSGGIFDSFIDGWHDTFGLSNNARRQFENSTLNYRYTRDGIQRVAITQADNGIGDLRLSTGYRILQDNGPLPRAIALRAGLKLPTGDPDLLLGSGGTDLSLSINFSDSQLLGSADWTLFGAAGIVALGNGDVLPELHRNAAGFGVLGVGWHAWRMVNLKTQLNTHTAMYRSDLAELGSDAIELIVGGDIALPHRMTLDIGVTENLFSGPTPDVALHLLLRRAY